ncbi:MAG: nucleotide exchange factor GrpE [Candidatus Humimicrobiaceae bacterium]
MKEKKDKEKTDMDSNKDKKTKGNGDYLKSLVTDDSISQGLISEELLEEIKLLREEVENSKKTEAEYVDRIKRIQADYDNYRKRTLKEHLELIKRANKDLIDKLLPVLDSFENALAVSEQSEKIEDEFYKGVRMIYNKLMDVLEKEGLKVIDPAGKEFDPQICEAAVSEASDKFKDQQIISVLRKGYMLSDHVIRPAVVKVCVKK